MHHVQLFLKDYVDVFAHPCISLLKCLYISHPSFYLPLLAHVAKHFICCKLFCFFSHLYSLACACVRFYLGGSEDSMLCTLYWNTNPICARTLGSSLLIFRTFFWIFLIACFFCWSFFLFDILLQSLDPQYSLISFPTIRYWICAFDFTHIMRNAHIMGELLLYWPSKFSSHFGNRCQWGRDLEGF